jgi:LuxR family maltose regulon positive regulatory protein
MTPPVLATKLYIPSTRPKIVLRPRLIERLNEGLSRKLILISAPAGFGKTTLLSEWLRDKSIASTWLSLDEGDSDPARFLIYLISALQKIAPKLGETVFAMLQTPQHPPKEIILTALLNEIATIPEDFVLILDDHHLIDSEIIDSAIAFLLENMPPQMHLVIASREDPQLPLSRLRVRHQLTELRVGDLRFNLSEAADFLKQIMGLSLSEKDIAALDARTEGWIAGLQLAAISMQGHQDTSSFIKSFTGSHHFVLDYLLEEVLNQQPQSIQTFLLRSSILERLSGSLCDALILEPSQSGQEILEYLERANLFIIHLDNERAWYRYHHLFADLLRQRLQQSASTEEMKTLHQRASSWYEARGLDAEAFHHAVAANDIENAARLVEGNGMPLFFRGLVYPVLNWLASLPKTTLDEKPSLWVMYASVLLFANQILGIEEKLQAAEQAMQSMGLEEKKRDLIGHIASIRATVAVSSHDLETILSQTHRALEYLHPDNLPVRTATTWTLAHAYQLQGKRVAAKRAYIEALSISQTIGHYIITVLASIGLGLIQELDNELSLASETYQTLLNFMGDSPMAVACEPHLGLARIAYQRNDLEQAFKHLEKASSLAQHLYTTDRLTACEIFLSRLKLAQGDAMGAADLLAKVAQSVYQNNYLVQLPELLEMQILVLIRQGNLTAASHLAQTAESPISQARLALAQGDSATALTVLESLRQQMEAKAWESERLNGMLLQILALNSLGKKAQALEVLEQVLAVAEPNAFVRLFLDEGFPMAQFLSEALVQGIRPQYLRTLLAAFEAEKSKNKYYLSASASLVDALSQRELEVLQLVAQGLSNHEISAKLFLALDTVKGHNRRIYDKLQVQRRTEAVARARELGLI